MTKEAQKTHGKKRSDKWPAVRKAFLKGKTCAVCGTNQKLEAHHVVPFHTDPARELDPANLLPLCEGPDRDCHRLIGHLGNFQSINVKSRQDAAALLVKVSHRPKWVNGKWMPT